jgi:hypothetical protein
MNAHHGKAVSQRGNGLAPRFTGNSHIRVLGVLFILVGFGCQGSPAKSLEGLEIRGEISMTFQTSRTTTTNLAYPFSVRVCPAGWNIQVVFGADHDLSAGFDGTNVYSLLNGPEAKKFSSSSGLVSEGGYPVNERWYITMPWLAYCSADLFKVGASVPAPWLDARNSPLASMCQASVTLTDQPPGLPDQIQFLVKKKTPDELRKAGWLNSAYYSPDALKEADPYQDAYLVADYRVMSWTNWEGLAFPASFELRRYSPRQTNAVSVIRGKANAFFKSSQINPLPAIVKPVSVADFRFHSPGANVDYINYEIKSNGNWLTGKPTELQTRFDHAKAGAPANQTAAAPVFSSGARRRVLLVLFAMLLVGPFLWWLSCSKRKSNRKLEKL